MAEQAEETSVRLLDVLIRFVDFLYAALFVAIVRESYEWVILGSVPTVYERTYRLALIAAVFYFFARDWLHGRILTIRNPFTRYRRFFTEVAIAVAGYGAAVGAARGEVTFVFYVAFMLAMRAVWAWGTIREHPGSSDRREISVLRDFQLLVGLLVAVTGFLWHLLGDEMVTMGLAVLFIVGGWLFVWCYEFCVIRPRGITGGPGVPFLSRELTDRSFNATVRLIIGAIAWRRRRRP